MLAEFRNITLFLTELIDMYTNILSAYLIVLIQ